MNLEKEINATISYWMDDVLFYFNESGKSRHEVAQMFKNMFNQCIDEYEKELDNADEEEEES